MRIVRHLPDAAAVYEAAADVFQRVATEARAARGGCRIALAGGSTPKGLYALLAEDARRREQVRWDALDIFWGDERHVPPDHPDSNYRMAYEAMLSRVPIPSARIHRVHTEENDPVAAAASYEAEIRRVFAAPTGVPRFDLILLGLGSDGHTASLFPGTAALAERERLVVANHIEKLGADRITFTLPLIDAARVVVFVVAGREKADAVRGVLQPEPASTPLPAALVQPESGELLWLIEAAAG